MMRPRLKTLLSLAVLLICAAFIPVHAQQGQFPAYVGHVNDFAQVIDPQTEERLEVWLLNFEKLTGTQIAAVTVSSLEGATIEEYANRLYEAWGIGAKTGESRDKGALLIVSIGDRKTRLEVGYGLEGDLPDGLAGEIIRRMRPELQQAQYSQAMTTGVRTLIDTLAAKWNVNIEGIEDRSYAWSGQARTEEPGGAGMLLLAGLFIFFLIMIAIASRSGRGGGRGGRGGRGGPGNLWWLYPIIFNRGGGTFGGGSWGNTGGWGSGGGWSGGGGGGGWGGFGGGLSGGGGASDSW